MGNVVAPTHPIFWVSSETPASPILGIDVPAKSSFVFPEKGSELNRQYKEALLFPTGRLGEDENKDEDNDKCIKHVCHPTSTSLGDSQ